MFKKILKILIVVIILAVIVGIAFWLFGGRSSNDNGQKLSIRDFFPFGRSSDSNNSTSPFTFFEETETQFNGELPAFRKLSESPMAGATSFDNNSETFARFIDKATGHIFDVSTKKEGISRITNTTMPKIVEANWAGKNNVVLRYLKDNEEIIESVLLRLTPPGGNTGVFEFEKDLSEGNISVDVLNLQKVLNRDIDTQIAKTGVGSPGNETNFFGPATVNAVKKFQAKYSESILEPQNLKEASGKVDELTREKLNDITGAKNVTIQDEEELYKTSVTFLPDNVVGSAYLKPLNLFYLQEDSLGTVGVLLNLENRSQKQIFDSGAKEWKVDSNENGLIVSTKATEGFHGLALLLDIQGNYEKIIGNIAGLTINLSPDKNKILFSESTRNILSFKLYDKNTTETFELNNVTLPEKCVWSSLNINIAYCAVPIIIPEGKYPDLWYQGVANFSDSLWILNSDELEMTFLHELSPNFDAINLFLDSKEQYLFLTNKKDSQLWSLRLFEDVKIGDTSTTTESI